MTKPIHNPHDHFFRKAMSDIRVAREFFKQHLPIDILQEIQLNSLQFQKESFIDENLRTSSADVLYSVEVKSKKSYLYLLVEHQSTIDHWIAFRLLCYIVRILQFHHEQYPEDDLPVVYPIIFYNGSSIYKGSTKLFDLFGENKDLAKSIFNEPFQLVDTQKIADEELRQYQWAGILEFVLKHRFARDFLVFAEQVMQWLHELEMTDGFDYAKTVLKYVVTGLEGKEANVLVEVAQQLSPKLGGEAMTFAEQWEQQGYKRGLQEGKTFAEQWEQQGYKRGLQEGKTFAEQSKQQGYKRGLQEGKTFAEQSKQQGYKRGLQEGMQTIIKKFIAKGISLETIAETTGLTIAEIKHLQIKEQA